MQRTFKIIHRASDKLTPATYNTEKTTKWDTFMNLFMKQIMTLPLLSWKKFSFNFDKVDQANKFREEATHTMLRNSYYI